MNTSYTLQQDVKERLEKVRKKMYGPDAVAAEYRDSFVLTNAILSFPLDDLQKLLLYKDADIRTPKSAKSVTLRANAYGRLVKMANSLTISESEACRLLIFYLEANFEEKRKIYFETDEIMADLLVLKNALEAATDAYLRIEKYMKEMSNDETNL